MDYVNQYTNTLFHQLHLFEVQKDALEEIIEYAASCVAEFHIRILLKLPIIKSTKLFRRNNGCPTKMLRDLTGA